MQREKPIELAVGEYLRRQVKHQVRCDAGIIDILTPDMVCEVEETLTRAKIFEAVGQVLLYRACVNPALKAVIAGKYSPDLDTLRPYVESLGIEVLVCSSEIINDEE